MFWLFLYLLLIIYCVYYYLQFKRECGFVYMYMCIQRREKNNYIYVYIGYIIRNMKLFVYKFLVLSVGFIYCNYLYMKYFFLKIVEWLIMFSSNKIYF